MKLTSLCVQHKQGLTSNEATEFSLARNFFEEIKLVLNKSQRETPRRRIDKPWPLSTAVLPSNSIWHIWVMIWFGQAKEGTLPELLSGSSIVKLHNNWAAHRFDLPEFDSCHWVRSLCLDSLCMLDLFTYISIDLYYILYTCMFSYCNMVRWGWWDW